MLMNCRNRDCDNCVDVRDYTDDWRNVLAITCDDCCDDLDIDCNITF